MKPNGWGRATFFSATLAVLLALASLAVGLASRRNMIRGRESAVAAVLYEIRAAQDSILVHILDLHKETTP